MKIETLKDRITKAEAKIEKKQNTIVKKTASIEKKRNALTTKYGINPLTFDKLNRAGFTEDEGHDIYWTMCDIEYLESDIENLHRQIEETKNTLEKYRNQLVGEMAKEQSYISEVPETVKTLERSLVEEWNKYDKERRAFYRKKYSEMGYRDFVKKYGYSAYEAKNMTDEEIDKNNKKDARTLVLQLLNRVKAITGDVTSWAGVTLEQGTWGWPTLNGVVIGKEGRARVESIFAGGYNIQRLHIRVLVHDISGWSGRNTLNDMEEERRTA